MKVNISYQNITSLENINFPSDILELDCSQNPLTSLKGCPSQINVLICDHTLLTSLKGCPKGLKQLWCSCTPIKSLKYLPLNLDRLMFHNTEIKSLKYLIDGKFNQKSLTELCFYSTKITNFYISKNSHLLKFPSLKILYCNPSHLKYFMKEMKSSEIKNFEVCIYDNSLYKEIYPENNKFSNNPLTLGIIRLLSRMNPNIDFFMCWYKNAKLQSFNNSNIVYTKSRLKIDDYHHLLKVIKLLNIKRIFDNLWNNYWYDKLIYDDANRFCLYSISNM